MRVRARSVRALSSWALADCSAALAAVIFSGSDLLVPEDVQDAVKTAFTEPAIDGVQVEFSSTIASEIRSPTRTVSASVARALRG